MRNTPPPNASTPIAPLRLACSTHRVPETANQRPPPNRRMARKIDRRGSSPTARRMPAMTNANTSTNPNRTSSTKVDLRCYPRFLTADGVSSSARSPLSQVTVEFSRAGPTFYFGGRQLRRADFGY
jgi:hypothetical protein